VSKLLPVVHDHAHVHDHCNVHRHDHDHIVHDHIAVGVVVRDWPGDVAAHGPHRA
jgi:hypothetical protein